jgi:V/A-type H+/Na+-transporting ATPase subunit K
MKKDICEKISSSPAQGRFYGLNRRRSPLSNWKKLAGMSLAGAFWLVCATSMAAETPSASVADQPSVYRTIGLGVAAAFAVSVSILGAGYAVGRVGSAALGAISEKPELLPRAILFVALAEGLAVLGFAFAMLLLQKM